MIGFSEYFEETSVLKLFRKVQGSKLVEHVQASGICNNNNRTKFKEAFFPSSGEQMQLSVYAAFYWSLMENYEIMCLNRATLY